MALVYNEITGEFEPSKDLSLKQYVRKIIESTDLQRTKVRRLNELADDLLKVFKKRHELNLSHGNINHESIIITPSNKIEFIDGDDVQHLSSYQHPKCLHQAFAFPFVKDDYFAEFIVYLSIKAIANDLSIWSIAKDNDQTLLLIANDYQNSGRSTTISKIRQTRGECELLCDVLDFYLNVNNIHDLEPFDILLERLTKDPVIKKFSASCGKKTLNGKSIVLSWDVENYTQILLDGKDVTTQISNTLTINSSTTYTLTVINGHKRTSKSIMVSSYSSPSVAVTASKTKLHKGRNESVTINWGVQNAEKITLLQDGVPIDKKCGHDDSYKCSVKDTTTFTVQALALDGKTTFSESVTVEVHPDAKFKLESDKEYVFPTIPFTISWTTKNAKRVELNGKKVAENGCELIKKGVDKDTTYTLSVTDEFGTKETSITVKQLPIPRIESILVPTPQIEQNITMNVDLQIPDVRLVSLDTALRQLDIPIIDMYDVQVKGIDTPKYIPLEFKIKTPTLWKKIEKSIAKLLHRNENR